MTLDEIKNSMSTLDSNLAQLSPLNFNLDITRCNTARTRLLRNYRKGAFSSLILGIVFTANWLGGISTATFPASFRCFLGIYLLLAAVWYAIITTRVKSIDIASSTPADTIKAVASFRKLVLCGETIFGVTLVIFFTLFLSHIITIAPHTFWIVLTAIVLTVILSLALFLPRLLRDFRNLTALTTP